MRAGHPGGTALCGGPDGHRHTGRTGPRRPRLAAWHGRLHDGRLPAGRGGVQSCGTDRSRHGGRLARPPRAAHRHRHRALTHVPAPRPLRRAAGPAPPPAQLLVLAGLVGAAVAGEPARSAAGPRLALAGRPPCAGAGPGIGGTAAGGRGPAGTVPARVSLVSGQGLGAAGALHRAARRRSDAGHRGGPLRGHGPGAAGDVRAGRTAARRRPDALSQRAAPAQGAPLLAGAGPRGDRAQRGGAAAVPGGAPGRPGVHGHLGPPRGARGGRRVRRVRRPGRRDADRLRLGRGGRCGGGGAPGRRRDAGDGSGGRPRAVAAGRGGAAG